MKKLKNFQKVKMVILTIFTNLFFLINSHLLLGQVPANISNNSTMTTPYDYRVEELKIRWKKAALDNCSPCPTGPVGPTGPSGCPTQSTVTSSTGRVWMDRNLGASRVATSVNDHLSYGHLFQWGRGADGHELINWTNGSTGSPQTPHNLNVNYNTDTPGNNIFSAGTSYPGGRQDWRHPANNNLWNGLNGTNNPCPCGFRIPTQQEWETEMNNGGVGTWGTGSPHQFQSAFNSILKIPYVGDRDYSNGALRYTGTEARYWTSTALIGQSSDKEAYYLRIRTTLDFFNNTNSSFSTNYRNYGYSVRCIKD